MVSALQQEFDVHIDGKVAQPADRLVLLARPAGFLLYGRILGEVHFAGLETLRRIMHHPPYAGAPPTLAVKASRTCTKSIKSVNYRPSADMP